MLTEATLVGLGCVTGLVLAGAVGIALMLYSVGELRAAFWRIIDRM